MGRAYVSTVARTSRPQIKILSSVAGDEQHARDEGEVVSSGEHVRDAELDEAELGRIGRLAADAVRLCRSRCAEGHEEKPKAAGRRSVPM